MIQLGLQNKAKEAFTLQYKMMDAINLIFEEGNPTGIKSMLHTQSFCENIVRLPLVEASEKLQNKIMTFLKEY
jgi:4-hydroxy-tetrahydrodipicolinate synthase